MIRKMLQSALCLFLSQMLVAQEAVPQAATSTDTQSAQAIPGSQAVAPLPEFVTIPKDTKIELVALESISSEKTIVGSSVKFAVAKDVVIDGITVLYAGMSVNGTVTKVKRGIANKQEGFLQIRVKKINFDGKLSLHLTSSNPEYRQTPGEARKERVTNVLGNVGGGGVCIALLPLCIGLAITMGDNGSGYKPLGKDAVMPMCLTRNFWIESAITIPSTEIAQLRPEAASSLQPSCRPDGQDEKIDWEVSDWPHLEVK